MMLDNLDDEEAAVERASAKPGETPAVTLTEEQFVAQQRGRME